MVDIVWKAKTSQYATGYAAFVGAIRVGGTERSLRRNEGWNASCVLPGVAISPDFVTQGTETDARKIVELAVHRWFKLAGLE
jgi:hypothetical protein